MELKIKKNVNGSVIEETLVYDFSLLTLDRIFAAEQLFILNNEFYNKQNVPGNTEQLNKAMERKVIERAYDALLMKKLDKGFEAYDEKREPDIFRWITGKEYQKIKEIKADFFTHSEILSQPSMEQSLGIISRLKEAIPESVLSELLKGAMNISTNSNENLGTSLEQSSILKSTFGTS